MPASDMSDPGSRPAPATAVPQAEGVLWYGPDLAEPEAAALAAVPGLTALSDAAALSAALAAQPERLVVLVHDRPAVALGRRLERRQAPERALATWRKGAERLLSLLRQHRPRVPLLEIGDLCASPAALVRMMGMTGARIEAAAPDDWPDHWPDDWPDPPPEPSPVAVLAGAWLLTQDPSLGRLVSELDVSTRRFAPVSPEVDLAAMFSRSETAAGADPSALALHRAQLAEMEAMLADVWQETSVALADLRQRNSDLERALAAQQSALDATIAARVADGAAERVAGTRAQADHAQQMAKVAQLQGAKAAAESRVAALEASTSWRLTAPMRWIGRTLLRRG